MAQIAFFAGSYTQAAGHVPKPAGVGISACYLNTSTGQIDKGPIFAEVENPSWLEWRADDLFAVYESFSGPSTVYRFSVNSDHTLTLQAQASCSGTAVCHFSLTGSSLYTAAYASGQMDVFDATQLRHLRSFEYQGSGPNRARQKTAHAHQVVISPEGRWCYVCDLGSDMIWRHQAQPLSEPVGIAVPAGIGPRHLVFHPSNGCVYLVSELTAELLTFWYSPRTGDLTLIDQVATLPEDF
ncbi:MAG: beta-propeller fold lactonase family protein, partial [Proteobacteria bacterium]|nr:beta-propeller fold lactonase family protein [Pseudomonadota bacterium]